MRHASMRRHEHTLYALNQEEIAGSPWIGYCMCGAIFKAPTESRRARARTANTSGTSRNEYVDPAVQWHETPTAP